MLNESTNLAFPFIKTAGPPDIYRFLQLLPRNTGIIVLKFTSENCHFCDQIRPHVSRFYNEIARIERAEEYVQVYEVNIDKESSALYQFFSKKKLIQGVPAFFAYHLFNAHFAPDDMVIGANLFELQSFFHRTLDTLRSTIDMMNACSKGNNIA